MVDAAIFFDNEPSYTASVGRSCRNIYCVTVPQTSPLPETSLYEPGPLRSFSEGLFHMKNEYVRTLLRLGSETDRYDPVSGLNGDSYDAAARWMAATNGVVRRAALFDFDRTITVFEGFFALEDIQKHPDVAGFGITDGFVRDQLVYLVGGEERLASLRSFFRWFRDNGCDIYVLTNNTSCRTDGTHNNLVKLLIELFEGLPFGLICGAAFKGNKARALLQIPDFEGVCPIPALEPVGGGRQRQRQRQQHKKTRRTRRPKS